MLCTLQCTPAVDKKEILSTHIIRLQMSSNVSSALLSYSCCILVEMEVFTVLKVPAYLILLATLVFDPRHMKFAICSVSRPSSVVNFALNNTYRMHSGVKSSRSSSKAASLSGLWFTCSTHTCRTPSCLQILRTKKRTAKEVKYVNMHNHV